MADVLHVDDRYRDVGDGPRTPGDEFPVLCQVLAGKGHRLHGTDFRGSVNRYNGLHHPEVVIMDLLDQANHSEPAPGVELFLEFVRRFEGNAHEHPHIIVYSSAVGVQGRRGTPEQEFVQRLKHAFYAEYAVDITKYLVPKTIDARKDAATIIRLFPVALGGSPVGSA